MSVPELLDPTTLLLGGALTLSLLWWLSTRRPPGLPPGPGPALPLLGHIHLVDKDPRAKFRAWRRQYGDVFSLYMGGRLVVVLNGFPVIKETLVKLAGVFSDRPHTFLSDKFAENRGTTLTFRCLILWPSTSLTACVMHDLQPLYNVLGILTCFRLVCTTILNRF